MTKSKFLGFGIFLLSATQLYAAGAPPTTSVRAETAATQTAEKTQRVFLSLSLNQGTSSLSNPVPDVTTTSGSRTEALLLASLRLNHFVFEGGGGWFHDRTAGTANPSGLGINEYELITD